jgi:hypothetical protein
MAQVFAGPGRLTETKGILTAIVQDHHEVLYYWQDFINATLLHVDGHKDMCDEAPAFPELTPDYHEYIDITGFICPAVHYGIVSSLYWLNPHSRIRLQDMGSKCDQARPALNTNIDATYNLIFLEYEKGLVITPDKIKLGKWPFILDVDLDAFSCNSYVENVPENYNARNGYKKRIKETIELLSTLRRPNLITISRSQGPDGILWRHVDPELVDKVQELFIGSLKEIY